MAMGRRGHRSAPSFFGAALFDFEQARSQDARRRGPSACELGDCLAPGAKVPRESPKTACSGGSPSTWTRPVPREVR
jgi:hypothetical protein